jgi:RNA polymerase sigma factor (sigma-70 family)
MEITMVVTNTIISTNASYEQLFSQPGLEEVLFSLDEYRTITERYLTKYFPVLLNDEDAIAFVAEMLMIGSCRWLYGGKKGEHRGYLMQCARWAALRWRRYLYISKKHTHISLHQLIHNDEHTLLYEIIADKSAEDPAIIVEREELIQLIAESNLTDKQKNRLYLVYIDGVKKSEAARQMGISRQAIEHSLKKGISKIRKQQCK